MIGVYGIIHIPSRTAYIGSSVDIDRRFREHKKDLKKNSHYCSYLQRAWNKYGETQFEFKVLCKSESAKEAREIEEAALECFFDTLYNSKKTAIGFASGDQHPAKKENWHMKSVKSRLSEEERKEKYGNARGLKRNPQKYIEGAAKRLLDPGFSKRLSEACKGKRKVVQCPHCGLFGGGGNMTRYHFDKCKINETT